MSEIYERTEQAAPTAADEALELIATLRATIGEKDAEIERLQWELNGAEGRISALKTAVDELQATFKKLF